MTVQDQLEARLVAALAPERISIRDDSAAHRGHAGAAAGGHFDLSIVSAAFSGKRTIERHRLVYAAVADLMQNGVHALSIDARAPGETTST